MDDNGTCNVCLGYVLVLGTSILYAKLWSLEPKLKKIINLMTLSYVLKIY